MSDAPPPKAVQGGLLSGLLDDLAPRQISMGDIGDIGDIGGGDPKQNKGKVTLKTHAQKVSGLKKQFLKLPLLSLFTLKQVFKVCARSSNGLSASGCHRELQVLHRVSLRGTTNGYTPPVSPATLI